MFVTRDGERLYLTSWQYNAMLIIDELARIVEEAGGRVKPGKKAIITNRAVSSTIREISQNIEHIEELNRKYGETEDRNDAIRRYREHLSTYEQFDNTPIEVRGQSWINFIIGDKYYYYSFDDNPFFDFNYLKTAINSNGEINANACYEADPRAWESGHSILSHTLTAEERKEIAKSIFDMLMTANVADIVCHSKRVRVDNTYDGGYHYENIREKPHYTKVDF